MHSFAAPEGHISVSQFAALRGLRDRKSAREYLQRRFPAMSLLVNGVETKFYDLRGSVEWQELQRMAGNFGLRSAADKPSAPWMPSDPATGEPIPAARVHTEAWAKAGKLRDLLKPILEMPDGVSDAERARRGSEASAAVLGHRIGERQLTKLLARTRKRAGARGDYSRQELYLEEHPRLVGSTESPAPQSPRFYNLRTALDRLLAGEPLERVIQDGENKRVETSMKRKGEMVYPVALDEIEQCVAGGMDRDRVEREARQIICKSGALPGITPDAVRKSLDYWGRKPIAEDLRVTNRGEPCSLTIQIEALPWFIQAAKYYYLQSNRGDGLGSVPEAIRRTISLPNLPPGWKAHTRAEFLKALGLDVPPTCPVELREAILARQYAGQPLVPGRIARKVKVNRTLMRFNRNPTDALLLAVNAAGCSRFTRVMGEYEPLRCGQRMQPDDGTINFCVCVPWKFPSDKCSRNFGVLVGRFQLLLFVDAMSLAIRARSFVVRPRSSYRQEDALHLYNIFMRQHGVPDEIWHEGHVWNSGRVKDCLDLLKVRRHLVHSPHNKAAVEGRFNKLWTVLSCLSGGQIGRYRGEMERENELLTSVRSGATDPRRVFPMIETAIQCIDQAIAEANATPVQTDVGRWVPDELWAEQTAATPLRKLEPGTEWMFAPVCLERQIKDGFNTKLPLFEDFSVPFSFTADFLPQFHGARARCYFDPHSDSCRGTIVLAQSWEGRKAGDVLGEARQTNDIADYARLMLGIGHGPSDDGRVMRQRQAAALRSDRRAIAPGTRGLAVVEQRDGIDQLARVEVDSLRVGTSAPYPTSVSVNPALNRLASNIATPDDDLSERLERADRWEKEHALELAIQARRIDREMAW